MIRTVSELRQAVGLSTSQRKVRCPCCEKDGGSWNGMGSRNHRTTARYWSIRLSSRSE
jgi:hypothetical protein